MKLSRRKTRREFLTLPAAAVGGTLLYTLAGEPIRLKAQDGVVRVPLRFFTEGEARVIGAACERIFPNDSSGPGATEAGVVVYIDRQLAGSWARTAGSIVAARGWRAPRSRAINRASRHRKYTASRSARSTSTQGRVRPAVRAASR